MMTGSMPPVLPIPFDADRLDRLMDEAGLDAILLTSKHNVQYMLGGYRFFMFDYMDAVGLSRYLPIIAYIKGQPDKAAYIANPNEKFELEERGFWTPHVNATARGTLDAAAAAAAHLRSHGFGAARIGVEAGFLPVDAYQQLGSKLPEASFHECVEVMESLRAVKTAGELDLLRQASEATVDAIAATFNAIRPGMSGHDIVEQLRREEVMRGLIFEYCLITTGTSLNRAPSRRKIAEGEIVSLDSGGNLGGYIGDLCRMGILGQPNTEHLEALAAIDEIQQAARQPLRAGCIGDEVFAAVADLVAAPRLGHLSFVAHGMGLVAHEAPRLMANGPIPYPAPYAIAPLESGMVLSIETTWQHPRLGFLKLEDTVAVTETGCEAFGDEARGWNRIEG